ncbi:hypothetical protein SSX86_007148 [Deinandra increscens subsp. villosa]|uniref:pectinesterase n=1 Tax=Deinandra increscens subsp. villosa TaxID=3103831 RepID=A0AAP0H9D5_9ASTR
MKIQIPPTLFLFFFCLLSTTTAGDTFRPPSTDQDFIRTSCQTTLYPQTCLTSLSGHSYSVQQNPGRLARLAIGVTLSKAARMAKLMANVSRHADYVATPRVAAAVHDCCTVFGDAVDEIRGALRQMRRLGGSGERVRFQLSNVQTWMSAALTDEDTCTDGFDDVAGEGVEVKDVLERVVKVKEVTSNALALVNRFADAIQTP